MGQSDRSIPDGCVGRCDDCGMPLRSWNERHTTGDCRWWRDTQPMRDALVGLGRLQREVNELTSRGQSET